MKKMYVVVRDDLAPGDQLAQAVHAASAFARARAEDFCAWVDGANNLVVLAIPNERDLQTLATRIGALGMLCELVHEPDLDNELTAIACDDQISSLVSSLPLALRWRTLERRIQERVTALPATA